MAFLRPTDKLNERWIGPFPVTKVYRRALAVELPEQYRVFPVFHLSLVQRHQQGFPGQEAANEEYDRRNAGVVLTDHPDQNPETEWYFDAITNSRLTPDGDLEYRVKWPAPHAATWEPARNVEGADDKIYEFHKKNPSKPGPPEWWRPPEQQEHPSEGTLGFAARSRAEQPPPRRRGRPRKNPENPAGRPGTPAQPPAPQAAEGQRRSSRLARS
jgi:hypothetical protein